MKKPLLLMIIIILFAVALSGCGEKTAPRDKVVYDISASLSDGVLTCSQKTTIKNVYKEGLDSVTFALFPNAYSEGALSPAYTALLAKFGGLDIKKITVAGSEIRPVYNEDKTYLTINIPACAMKEKVEVDMDYTVTLPECDLRLGIKDGYFNISNFYPQLPVYDNDAFRTDAFSTVGDPVFSPLADFHVSLDMPADMEIAAPGTVAVVDNAGRRQTDITLNDARDLAFVLKAGYKYLQKEVDGVAVRYYYVDEADPQSALDVAAQAIEVFSSSFGAYPYETFVVASTPFKDEGMEYSGLVFVDVDSEDKAGTVIHETAHQWFYNLVGSDNINSAYLDEGLTTYCAEYFYLLTGDENGYNEDMHNIEEAYTRYERIQRARGNKANLCVTEPIYKYTSYQYTMLAYYKPAVLFKKLYDMGGKEKFNASIKNYVESNRFGIADKDDLIAAFSSGMKTDVSGVINGFLSEGAVVATFAR